MGSDNSLRDQMMHSQILDKKKYELEQRFLNSPSKLRLNFDLMSMNNLPRKLAKEHK
jgi:hypothetical protein